MLLDLYKYIVSYICSVILRVLESFRNYKGFCIIFSKILECNLTYYVSENFSDFSLHHIF